MTFEKKEPLKYWNVKCPKQIAPGSYQSARPKLQACQPQGAAIEMTNNTKINNDTNLCCHIQFLHTQEGLAGIQTGRDLYLKQLDRDNLKTKSNVKPIEWSLNLEPN